MPTDTPELLPCPFCGGVARMESEHHGSISGIAPDTRAHFAVCNSCGCVGPWAKSATGAARLWGRRESAELERTNALLQNEHRAISQRLDLMQGELHTMRQRLVECEEAVDQAVALAEYLEGHSKGAMAERVRTALSVKFAQERRDHIAKLEADRALLDSGTIKLDKRLWVSVDLRASIRTAIDAGNAGGPVAALIASSKAMEP